MVPRIARLRGRWKGQRFLLAASLLDSITSSLWSHSDEIDGMLIILGWCVCNTLIQGSRLHW